MRHCWADRKELACDRAYATDFVDCDEWVAIERGEILSGVCLLREGHEGPHDWTPDDEITLTFAPEGSWFVNAPPPSRN